MGFGGWPPEALTFYEGLEADNSKAYWTANKRVYDETVRAPFEWDLLRFAVSLRLSGQEAACGRRQLDDAVLAFSRAYRGAMDRFASMPFIDVNPRLAALRGDPRFAALRRKVGLT